jgi:hypothetical protein
VRLLQELRGRLPVAIPEPAMVAADDSCFAYPYLPGEPLEAEIEVELWGDVVAAVGAVELDLPPFSGVESRLALVEHVRGDLPPELRRVADRVLAEYAPRYEAATSRALPMHGDLGLSHFLVDAHGAPYAVIDWSDACRAPVEHELANLYWTSPALVAAAAARFDADPDLAALDHFANALSDIGELHAAGRSAGGVIAHLQALA